MPSIKHQLLLAIEASSSAVCVGLSNQGKPIGELWLDAGQPGGQLILAAVEHLLQDCQLEFAQVEGLCVCPGPGSFTGMRVALATVSALAFANKLPIYTVDRLRLTAATVTHQTKRVRVIQNAFKGELAHQAFDCSGERPEAASNMELIRPESLLSQLGPQDLLLGEGVGYLSDKGFDLRQTGVICDQGPARHPTALGLIHLLATKHPKEYSPLPLEPLYLRSSEAEINFAKRFGEAD